MNILIIGYCHLDDGFLYAAKALEKLNYKIFFFPYLNYVMDKIENRDEILIEKIKKDNINICLWWNNSIKFDNFKKILNKNNNIKNYLFNWDPFLYNYEKYNCIIWKERIYEKDMSYPLMDHIFSCFESEINYFKNKLPITYTPPGFDLNISKYVFDENYICDISIVCTNFYKNIIEFPNETTNITRYEIVDKLYENRNNIKFHIYGPENFKNIYPECYKGFIKYQECNKVFSNSKINLSIHPMVNELSTNYSKEEYFSERVPQILGCKGLLVTNSNLNNKLKKNKDYIYIDNDIDWYSKLLHIIKNSEKYNYIRNNGYNKAYKNYQWDNWAEKISSVINNKI
jgi:hypothetical protein